jgi:Right handed beta helix region
MLDLRTTSGAKQPIVVVNNAFCFAHDVGPPCGTGGDHAIGIRINRSAVVKDNVFVSCGNAAIALYRDLDRVSIDDNLFYLTPRDAVNSRASGNTADITETNIDELEDVGLKSANGNIVQDPGMSGFRPEWLDAYSRHLLANYVKPPREAANAVRIAAGLPGLTPADLDKEENKGDFAPRFAPLDALGLHFTAKQGFHAIELAAEIAAPVAQAAVTYRTINWDAIDTPDDSLAHQSVELRAGLGFEQNTNLLADADPSTHMGIRIYRPGSDDGSIYVLAKRFALPNRQFEEAIKYTNGREVESTYLLRGIYRTDIQSSRQKATLVVDSILPAPFIAVDPPARPEGRDWFVRAGASGGDGTHDKPFRDPFQALDKAEGGDIIHVAGGDYFGKLRSGKWKILIRNLVLLGGYNAEFTERDPWKNPTRFLLTEEERAKGTPEGTVLASEENSDGLILDGFIFDGATYNIYDSSGSLDLKRSPLSPLVALRGGRAITVRNCLFLNASGAGISIDSTCGVFENNVLVNVSGWSLKIRGDGPGPWIIRNNTILFACDPTPRAGTGKSSADGTLFHLNGRAVAAVDGNIFAFGDNFGVRTTIAQQNVSFDNNVLAANLFNHLTDCQYLWADGSNWERRAVTDSSFASFKNNTLELPKLPVDPGFGDAALKRLLTLPSRITTDQWKVFANQIGSSAMPAASDDKAAAETPKSESAKPEPAHDSSLNSILASLSSIQNKMKEMESTKTSASSGPLYCPVFDWKKVLVLAQETSTVGRGAHKAKLIVSFMPPRQRPEIQYTQVTPQAIDADHASLDNKAVDLQVTAIRSSSSNPSLFPTGTASDDYMAYSVTTVSGDTRTPIAIIVRLDTAASKLLNHTNPTDKVRIRGTARIPANPHGLSIIVDNAEAVEI